LRGFISDYRDISKPLKINDWFNKQKPDGESLCYSDFKKKNELIGVMKSGGYSSKISFINHLKEEMKIRYLNGQNLFFLSLIFFNSIIKNLFK